LPDRRPTVRPWLEQLIDGTRGPVDSSLSSSTRRQGPRGTGVTDARLTPANHLGEASGDVDELSVGGESVAHGLAQ